MCPRRRKARNFRRERLSIPMLIFPGRRMSDETPTPPPAPSDDAELAALPSPPRSKSPILALAVIVLAGVLVWHLRHDVAFAFAGKTPTDLGDARALAAGGAALEDNRFVTVAGQAERRYALYVEPRGERARQT